MYSSNVAELFLDGQERLGILDRRLDLQPVANDAGIREQALLLSLAVLGDDGRVEVVEGFPVVLSLLENRLPTQARLRPFEDQELEERAVVMDRHAPLLVVVFDVLLGLRPRAAALLWYGHLADPLLFQAAVIARTEYIDHFHEFRKRNHGRVAPYSAEGSLIWTGIERTSTCSA